ncbi:hypothetical protein L2E82_04815 [Cichorium intybus]|uniref:Uncharacterized protein n=1 Tax=Cichorium intybus TaxID=13427 RepID=A0ACB9H6K2_CICIN|nr:hypothetical protein L2E82_04815 [Cichorium intybus]
MRDRRRFLKSREETNGGSQPPELLPVPSDDGLGVSHRWVRKAKKDRRRGGILVAAPHLLDLLMFGSLLTDLVGSLLSDLVVDLVSSRFLSARVITATIPPPPTDHPTAIVATTDVGSVSNTDPGVDVLAFPTISLLNASPPSALLVQAFVERDYVLQAFGERGRRGKLE